jgi:G3E family GTPase
MAVKVDVISGFLGAGKTTLIKKLVEEKLHSEKLVIIENEFGEIGIDGSILKNSGMEIKEINSGCICCTLVGDFSKSIEEVISKYKPDRIIIEPSGVGKLYDVIKACDIPTLKDILKINMIITVVDVLKYQIYISNFGEFFENQIKHAKTIIMSRTQQAENKKMEPIVTSIRKLNSKANIVTTPWETLKADQITAIAEQDASILLENQMTLPKVVLKRHHHSNKCKCEHHHSHTHHHEDCGCSSGGNHNHRADEVFDVWGTETPKVFEEERLKVLVNQLGNDKSFGMVLRGKGILQISQDKWVQFDYVPGEVQIKSTNPDYTGRICIIGSSLQKEELRKLFQG